MRQEGWSLEGIRRVFEGGRLAGLPGEIVRFGLVGTAGFLTDATVLTLLFQLLDWNPYGARRRLSFLCAIALTRLPNRFWVFFPRAGANRRRREYLRYLPVQVIGGSQQNSLPSLLEGERVLGRAS